ncbi:unnamed protein product [Calicophoron daubneyi]|uniref:Uncharacterized protein n=1 Tax=Calicophoron daubneyi TaxID=300641 RepID=A0AAV2T0D7_CALDB
MFLIRNASDLWFHRRFPLRHLFPYALPFLPSHSVSFDQPGFLLAIPFVILSSTCSVRQLYPTACTPNYLTIRSAYRTPILVITVRTARPFMAARIFSSGAFRRSPFSYCT